MQFVAINRHICLLTLPFCLEYSDHRADDDARFRSHVLAAAIGAPLSVVIGGLGSLTSAAVAAVKSKSLIDFEV